MVDSKKSVVKEDLTKSITHERPKPNAKPPTSRITTKKNQDNKKK